MKKEKAKNGTMKKVLSLVKPYRALIALSILCALFSVAGALLIPVFTGDAIDFMLGPGKVDFAVVGKKALLIAAAAALTGISFSFAVEYVWFYPRDLFCYFLLAGVTLAAARLAETDSPQATIQQKQ